MRINFADKKANISIAFASDLHLAPFRTDRRIRALNLLPEVDFIVLAGDIAVGMQAVNEAFELADRYPTTHVIFVAGNHEFYDHNIDKQIEKYRKACADHDRVHYIEDESVELLGLTFIGATLWSDFSILGEPELSMDQASRMISDFRYIKTDAVSLITPDYIATKFRKSYEFLDETLAICDPKRTVVISHFPPGLRTRKQNFSVDPLTAYFQANADYLLEFYQPMAWIYGHNHFSNDLRIGRTRLASNQLGYSSEVGRIPKYDPQKLIVLSAGEDHDTEN